MEIVKANLENLSDVARLFDLYRQFYDCQADYSLATRFIKERMENSESDIFIASDGNSARGFVQLYPSFCSVQAVKIYILYDLYVESDCRRAGLAERLMKHTSIWAKQQGAARLDLLTAKNNKIAQSLYEKLGYRITNEDCYAYSLRLC